MTKLLLAGAAAIALMTGAAFAQSVTETTTSRTTVAPPPPVDAYTATRHERSSFGGASVDTEKSVSRDGRGNVSSSIKEQVVRPDGSSETNTHKEWSAAPVPPPASSTTTTTTINR